MRSTFAVSRVASQRLGILRKSWEVFHDRLLLGRCFTGSVLPILEYNSFDTHLKLLDRVVSGESFLTEGMSECDLAHRRYVAVLCMLYKIRSNPLHPLYGALSVPYVPVWVTSGADRISVHLFASSLQNLAVSQDFYSFVIISVERSWWPRIRWCGTGGIQEQDRKSVV